MPKYSLSIREEELKNKVAEDWFPSYDTTQIIGNIDFCIAVPQDGQSLFERDSLLWAEAKAGRRDIYESFVQLILTIGKAKTFNKHLPPAFLGAFDTEKMAFIQYNKIMDVFDINDFNWNVTPSDHESKEFKLLYEKVKATLGAEVLLYNFETDEAELRKFIKENFVVGKAELSKIQINKNNFTHVYQKWLEEVRDSIDIDWNVAKAEGLIDADFYLADLLSENNISLKEKLFVLLKSDHYMFNICRKATGAIDFSMVMFSDNQIAHTKFWNRYIRPPKQEYWDYIVGRRDLLVPQDIRERKGSYFTPKRWVELSQQYIADELGENWQDEYYVWDCAAGTGNLLNGLTNKYNIWASTLDKQDVDVMHDLIKNGKLNLLEKHVFRFDFLNDDFNMLPEELKKIIDDPDKRKKLIIYINPPYAEAASKQTVVGHGENKINVAVKHLTYKKYLTDIGLAGRELFAQFFIRIYFEIPSCVLAEFSKLKILQAPNFRDFRNSFQAKLGKGFIVPAYTFDNVKGAFPIGFFVWHLSQKEVFSKTVAEVYDEKSQFIGNKVLLAEDSFKTINDWIISTRNRDVEIQIGYMSAKGNDFQNMNYNFIINRKEQLPHPRGTVITDKNLRAILR